MKINIKALTAVFLVIELILYYFVLTAGGGLLVWCSFGAILLCFLYAVTDIKSSNPFIILGLGFTVVADMFLVVWQPQQQLWGMIFFLTAQSIYALMLHRKSRYKSFIYIRIILISIALITTATILRSNTDLLAIISMCYYVMLIINLAESFCMLKYFKFFAFGLVLFLLCDTVIGLQVASEAYLNVSEDSFIHRIIFVDFNLSWFFYLPSQVLIALSSKITRSN